MSTVELFTQIGLRLEMLTMEVQSLIARTVQSATLNAIAEYCVPRRLLGSFTIWGQRGNDGLMRMTMTINYDEHDRQVTVTGNGLPTGVAGTYILEQGTPGASRSDAPAPKGCPQINKAIDLFVRTAKARGLCLTWSVTFTAQHAELYKRFNFVATDGKFRDLTAGLPSKAFVHSEFPELTVEAFVADDPAPSSDRGPRSRGQ